MAVNAEHLTRWKTGDLGKRCGSTKRRWEYYAGKWKQNGHSCFGFESHCVNFCDT